jgi:hypothetical protein
VLLEGVALAIRELHVAQTRQHHEAEQEGVLGHIVKIAVRVRGACGDDVLRGVFASRDQLVVGTNVATLDLWALELCVKRSHCCASLAWRMRVGADKRVSRWRGDYRKN